MGLVVCVGSALTTHAFMLCNLGTLCQILFKLKVYDITVIAACSDSMIPMHVWLDVPLVVHDDCTCANSSYPEYIF